MSRQKLSLESERREEKAPAGVAAEESPAMSSSDQSIHKSMEIGFHGVPWRTGIQMVIISVLVLRLWRRPHGFRADSVSINDCTCLEQFQSSEVLLLLESRPSQICTKTGICEASLGASETG